MLDQPHKTAQQAVEDWLYDQTKGIVQSGPFAGMKLMHDRAWDSGALCPMLLGCHEAELHKAIEQEITRLETLDNPKIVNVGCAEGYYAVGLARRLPKATIWAVDILDEAQRIAANAAIENNVNIIINDAIDNAFATPDFIVMDCEGDEAIYLNPDNFPALAHTTIIVEIHNRPDRPWNVGELLIERFVKTHDIENVPEAGRNPNEFMFLLNTSSQWRWMCVCENRPCFMNYFVMRPR